MEIHLRRNLARNGVKIQNKIFPESLVNYTDHTQIFNNKNMFILGLSYDFSSGKKLQIQINLINSTAPAATF